MSDFVLFAMTAGAVIIVYIIAMTIESMANDARQYKLKKMEHNKVCPMCREHYIMVDTHDWDFPTARIIPKEERENENA